jgi:hypothetical protein
MVGTSTVTRRTGIDRSRMTWNFVFRCRWIFFRLPRPSRATTRDAACRARRPKFVCAWSNVRRRRIALVGRGVRGDARV